MNTFTRSLRATVAILREFIALHEAWEKDLASR
jgi:hypothetical protein